MFCVMEYVFDYRVTMPNGSFAKSVTFPNASGNYTIKLDENGILDGARFTSEVGGLFEAAKAKGLVDPENTFAVKIGFDGGSPIPVPVGNLEAVWSKLKPLCANAKTDLFPPRPATATISAPELKESLPGSGRVTLSCTVTGRRGGNPGQILVSIDMNRGAYAIMNPASHAVSGVFGMFSVDTAYRLQTASPMGLLLIDRRSGKFTNYSVSELMGADYRGFCAPAPSYVPFN